MARLRTASGWTGIATAGTSFPIFANTAARDAALPSPIPGTCCVTTDTGSFWQYFASGGTFNAAWYRPNARLFRSSKSTDDTGVTTGGLTMGFTPSLAIPPNRLIGIYGHYSLTVLQNGAFMYARYNTGGNVIAGRMDQFNGASGNGAFSLNGMTMFGSGGGISTVFDVVIAAVSGTVNVVSSQDLGWYEVWDMGAQ
jgi:hypothetical protein